MKMNRSVILMILIVMMMCLFGCSGGSGDDRKTVHEDMKDAFEEAGLISANVGIVSKVETEDSVSYGEFGSGAIFDKDEGYYYVLTAAHVVSVENAKLLVFTVNTEMKSETLPGTDITVLNDEVYELMYPAEVLYVSHRDDLAVIRFHTDEDLSVMKIADSDPEIGDRIMCIGNPRQDWFALSYGKIISGIEKFGETQGFPSNIMKHDAYIQVGSSGGAVIDEEMKLIGITTGASLSPDGTKFYFGATIPVSEIEICLEEWGGRPAAETDLPIVWDEITKDGVDEDKLIENIDTDTLESIADKLQGLCTKIDQKGEEDEEYWLRGEWYDDALKSEEYAYVVSLKEKAMKPLFLILYKSENAGMYEWICAKALEEISGYDFSAENNGNGWKDSKEFLELFIQKVQES